MTNKDKQKRLDAAVDSLRLRFGASAVVQLREDNREEIPHISSGFAALDVALGIGGFPRGQISHLAGVPTSGATTIALKTLAQAVQPLRLSSSPSASASASRSSPSPSQGAIGYLDMLAAFDADYAARCGIDVNNLVLLTPRTIKQAVQSIVPLLPDAAALALALRLPPAPTRERADRAVSITSGELSQLAAQVRQSSCALLIIEQAATPSPAITHIAVVQLKVQRLKWLYRRGDVSGYRTAVTVLRNQHGATGRRLNLTIGFSGAVAGDGV